MNNRIPPNDLGLSLSGGGYRAAAFHLGTMRALHKMHVLEKIDVLSTISGGSITGAAYCLYKGDYPSFEKDMISKLSSKNVIKQILLSWSFLQLLLFTLLLVGGGIYFLFTPYAWAFLVLFTLWIVLLLKYQFAIFPAGKEVEKAYDKFYYQKATLQDLCKKPVLAIGSSNLQTGRPFTFSYRKMSDSTYASYNPPIYFLQDKFPVARAVTASSCVPFAFTPVPIAREFYKVPEDYNRIDPKLIDGGVYDNQGIQKLTQSGSSYECKTVITSDAGGQIFSNNKYRNTVTLLVRTVDLFMNRIKMVQMVDNIYENTQYQNRQIAYLSLGWDLENCIPGFVNNMIKKQVPLSVMQTHQLPQEWINDPASHRNEIQQYLEQKVNYKSIWSRNLTPEQLQFIRSTGTNLTPLSEERVRLLAQHAENLTELQVKLYCPSIC